MCFFPFVGFFIGGVDFLLCFLAKSGIFPNLTGFELPLALTLFPVLLTGGIHLDGFMDTSDALASHASRERKLEILKDSRVGAFAVINVTVYFLAYFVISSHFTALVQKSAISMEVSLCLASIFPLSRFLSALAVATFNCAKGSGLAKTFQDSSAKKFTRIWCVTFLLAIYSLITARALFFWNFNSGKFALVFCVLFFDVKKTFWRNHGRPCGLLCSNHRNILPNSPYDCIFLCLSSLRNSSNSHNLSNFHQNDRKNLQNLNF